MANEKRLIDACALRALFADKYDRAFIQMKTRENIDYWDGVCGGVNWGLNTIGDAPTVDAVEVVRCKDCKYWFAEDPERCKNFGDDLYGWCHRQRNIYEADHKEIRQDNDFCSYGERKV